MKQILVTGAGGFVGQYFMKRAPYYFPGANIIGIKRDTPLAYALFADTDILFYLAGSKGIQPSIASPMQDLQDNVHSLLSVLNYANNGSVKKIVFVSSLAVYGDYSGIISEDCIPKPISPYGISKLCAEQYLEYYARKYKLNYSIVRPTTLYGYGQNKLVIYDLIQKALHESPPIKMFGTGNEVRDLLHVEDLCDALARVGVRGNNEVYNVGSGTQYAIKSIMDYILSCVGKRADCAVFEQHEEAGKVSKIYPNITKLASLGFKAKHFLNKDIIDMIKRIKNDSGK